MTQNDQVMETPAAAAGPRVAGAVRTLAQVILGAVLVQFVLGGLGAFDTAHSGTFKDTYFTVHDNFALVIIGLEVVMFVVALVTRSGRMVVWESVALGLVTGPVQHLLATAGTDTAPWVGSLHVLTGVLILLLDAHVAFPGIAAAVRLRPTGSAGSSDAA